MRNLLNYKLCQYFNPTFTNQECLHYEYADNGGFDIIHGECGFCKLPDMYRCIADTTRSIPLSYSSVSDFLTCHHLYYLKAIRGIRVKNAQMGTALKAGKLWDVVKQYQLGARDVSIAQTIEDYEIDPMTVAKVRALIHAYRELEIEVDPDFDLQAKITLNHMIELPQEFFVPTVNIRHEPIDLFDKPEKGEYQFNLMITGYYDRKYPTYFCEDKLTSRPDNYLNRYFIQSQNGTYFMADPSLEYCIEEVVALPQLKSTGVNKEESADSYMNRCYQDIISKPSKYFIGWDKEKRMYGKKFFRDEFDLDQIAQRYKQVVIEILAARQNDAFYRNDRACNSILPGIPCDYQSICHNNVMSEEMFEIRERKEEGVTNEAF